MNEHEPTDVDTDELIAALANNHNRAVLSLMQDSSESVFSTRGLADAITKQDHGGAEQVTIELHHRALPHLADVGVVEYDPRSNTVRYRGHADLEPLLESVTDSEMREI